MRKSKRTVKAKNAMAKQVAFFKQPIVALSNGFEKVFSFFK